MCTHYLDPNGFFTNQTHEAADMVNICDQSKILSINYFDKTIPGNLYSVNSSKANSLDFSDISFPSIEGFTSGGPPGERNTNGFCEDGYTYENGRCKQVCTNCKYSDRTRGKSTEFNEFDPCFSGGVFNGLDNQGNKSCTCGKNNQYCSNDFVKKLYTTDGMFFNDGDLVVNIANANDMENYSLFE
tara:strand:+ start:22 stop:579 length:558 start_codon:yes stop_codon:yes gene_type:complete